MFLGEVIDLLDLGAGDLFPQGEGFETTLQAQGHGFSHTGKPYPWGKSEVEVKVYRTRNLNHSAVDDQDILPFCCNLERDIPRA